MPEAKLWSKTKPILIYDGECGFCKWWISRWKDSLGDSIEYAPYQEVASQFPQITFDQFKKSVQLVEPDGAVSSAAKAVFRAFAYGQKKSWLLWSFNKIPLFAASAEWFYRLVADHRSFFFRLTRIFWGKNPQRSTYGFSSWFFLRCLAVIYFVAFVSMAVQILGLVGSKGILPANVFLDFVSQRFGIERYWLLPTLVWLNSSDFFLQVLCIIGGVFSVLLLFGVAPTPVLFVLWFSYLSLVAVCRDFLAFQWDVLLLEAGFLAIFLVPPTTLKHSILSPPTIAILRLLKWLLFRLIFSSGIAKLLSGDPTWRDLSALNYHYETQPLPTWIGWYAHHLPVWFQKLSVVCMFAVELFVPILIFCPRRLRMIGFYILVGFQILILLTGNYAFFNVLAIALAFLLLDDQTLPTRWHKKLFSNLSTSPLIARWPRLFIIPFAVPLFALSLMQMSITLRLQNSWPKAVIQLENWIAPFRSINRYGLFAVMTTSRPEIIIEGSNDGLKWRAYEFKYKPGDLKRAPAFVAPHQPRLDWQMWFAALGSYAEYQWFTPFCQRLLENSPEVLSLLANNPFPDQPPRYLRAHLYQYHFTDLTTKQDLEIWWRRDFLGPYAPVMSVRNQN